MAGNVSPEAASPDTGSPENGARRPSSNLFEPSSDTGGGGLLRAFLWLRWRTLANSLGRRGRRSLEARLQAWVEFLTKVLLGLFLGLMALGLTVGAGFAAPLLAGDGPGRAVVLFVLRGGLAFLLVALLFFAVFQAARGGGSRMTRLLLLPVSRRRLHGLELAASLGDPWILAVVPGLLLLVGVTALLRPAGAVPVLLALGLFLALLATLAATAAFAVQLVFRNRRRAEWVTLVAFVIFMVLTVMPATFEERKATQSEATPPEGTQPAVAETVQEPPSEAAATDEATTDGKKGEGDKNGKNGMDEDTRLLAETFPVWLQPFPTEAFALVLARSSGPEPRVGHRAEAWLGLGALAAELSLLYLLSLSLWRRLLADPESASGSRGTGASPLPSLSLPGLPPAAAAVAWAQVRGVWRTLQGRLALVMPLLVLPVMAFIFRPGGEAEVDLGGPMTAAPLLALGAVAFTLLGQQAVLLNQFGIEDSGLSLTLLGPLSGRDVVLGKAVAGAVTTLASLSPALVVVAVFFWRASPLLWPSALLAALATYGLFAPLAAWISVLLPKSVDLGQIGKQGQAHQGAAMLGMLSLGFVLGPAAGLGLIALGVWKSPWLLLLAQAILAVICCGVAVPLLHLAGGAMDRRREALFLTVAEGE